MCARMGVGLCIYLGCMELEKETGLDLECMWECIYRHDNVARDTSKAADCLYVHL